MRVIQTIIAISFFILSSAVLAQDAAPKSVVKNLSHSEFIAKVEADDSAVIIDVRTAAEFAQGHVPNAINIPHKDILANVSLLKPYHNRDMIFYCRSGRRVSWVTNYLIQNNTLNGAVVYHLKGDMNAWSTAGLPIGNSDCLAC